MVIVNVLVEINGKVKPATSVVPCSTVLTIVVLAPAKHLVIQTAPECAQSSIVTATQIKFLAMFSKDVSVRASIAGTVNSAASAPNSSRKTPIAAHVQLIADLAVCIPTASQFAPTHLIAVAAV